MTKLSLPVFALVLLAQEKGSKPAEKPTHAMISTPHLKVQVENGLYDFAAPFFGAEHTMDHLSLPDKLRANIQMEYYNAGHMMSLWEADLQELQGNISNSIRGASGM